MEVSNIDISKITSDTTSNNIHEINTDDSSINSDIFISNKLS